MSLTYGYDLKDGDKILEAPHQTTRLMAPLVLPGAALVNHVPICAISNFIPAMLGVASHLFQCGMFLPGSHTSATNRWHELFRS
jgi:hypothetical protein